MAMNEKPIVKTVDGGKIWEHRFERFWAKVFVPHNELRGDVINYGYDAPCFLVFCSDDMLRGGDLSDDEAIRYAEKSGLAKIAASFDISVVFIAPLCPVGWKNADGGIFEELISNTKIHQYYTDGIAILNNRFFKTNEGFAIRGAIFRSCVIAKADAADYVATHLLEKIEGDGLWGKADICPTVCVLQGLSVAPQIARRDMPIVSVYNGADVNSIIARDTDYSFFVEAREQGGGGGDDNGGGGNNGGASVKERTSDNGGVTVDGIGFGDNKSLVKEAVDGCEALSKNSGNTTEREAVSKKSDGDGASEASSKKNNGTFAPSSQTDTTAVPDFTESFNSFIRRFIRWGWHGELSIEDNLAKMGVAEDARIATLATSADNAGDDTHTQTHAVGYICYYNKALLARGEPLPLVLCFHGGGDSAKHIAKVSAWVRVCRDHNFLLVCVENHLNSTATEMTELLNVLKTEFPIDETRIYATGFSMGGCKTWDLFQEYPRIFAGMAPMDATFDVGQNLYGNASVGMGGTGEINKSVLVPLFYAGGEQTPLPELPFQAQKCFDRIKYVLDVNDCAAMYDCDFNKQNEWENKIWGISGDKTEKIVDDSRAAVLTIEYFKSRDGNTYTAFASVDNQGHECRYHTCEHAYRFLSRFRRVNGTIEVDG